MKKPIKKTRGTGTVYEDDSFEFTPQGTGEPKYEAMCKLGQSHISRTTGERKQSYIAHLKVDADEADPAEALHTQIDKLAQKIWPASALPPKPRGKMLYNRDGALAAVNSKTGIIRFSLELDLKEGADYQRKLINALTQFTQCLYSNQDYLTRVARALANNSKQSSTATR